MKTIATTLFIISLVFTILGGVVLGQLQNLSVDQGVTTKIQALDTKFFKGFDVYTAGVDEAPTALLFDLKKDKIYLPDQFWGKPLSEKELLYALQRLNDQYLDRSWGIPMSPRALNVVNSKGKVLGYVFTGIDSNSIIMDRKQDARVTVYKPAVLPKGGSGGGGGDR